MLTDHIAQLIEEMLNEQGGRLELQRNELANRMGCVPSQISYVISSRFTPERGYIIESHRGGGGCIRIVRKRMDQNEYLAHFFSAIGDALDERDAFAYLDHLTQKGILTEEGNRIARSAVSSRALSPLPPSARQIVRASLFKQMLLSLMSS